MRFRTQEELLRHLGKSNDRNLIKRLMARGEVWKEDWMYCFGEEEERPEMLTISNGAVQAINEARVKLMEQDLKEAKVNAEYWEAECRRYWRLINNVISVCYRKLKGMLGSKFTMSEEEFREWIIEEVKMWEG